MSARITAGTEYEPFAELARQLGFSRQRGYQMLKAGRVPGAFRIGRFWFVPRAVIVGMKLARNATHNGKRARLDGPTRVVSDRPRREAAPEKLVEAAASGSER